MAESESIMDISKSSGPDLLPRELPDRELLGAWDLSPEITFDVARLPEVQRRTIHWTLAIDRAFETGNLWRDVPGYRFASCGFADPDFEADAFGVIIYAEPSFDYQSPREPISELRVGDHTIRVLLRYTIEVLHIPTAHPMYGTAACWAQSGKKELEGRDGLLTAKEVVQPPRPCRSRRRAGSGGSEAHGERADEAPYHRVLERH